MKRDSISMKEFTNPTRIAICDYYESKGWEELDDKSFLQPENAALMWFRLRQAPDDIFPRGKWATLQHLESMVDEMVKS